MKEIVIKLPDVMFKYLEKRIRLGMATEMDNIVWNGKVLPKGHGELKDVKEILTKIHAMQMDLESNFDKVWEKNKPKYKGMAYANGIIIDAPTLVEADKGETDGNK